MPLQQAAAAAGLGPEDLPPELRDSVERHAANLARLVAGLRSTGMDDALIEESVASVVGSYRQELLAAIRRLNEQRDV